MGLRRPLLLFLLTTSLTFPGCSGLFYHPSKEVLTHPEAHHLQYRTVRFSSSDGKMLAGWFFPAETEAGQKPKGTVVQFHGNAENRTSHYLSLVWLVKQGYNLFTFDYRGYDGSEGQPSQEGTYRDGMAAIRFIKGYVPAGDRPDLVLYGQSLGGAILARCVEDLPDRSRILSVVIESSFDSYQAIAKNVLSRFWLTWPLQFLGLALVSDQYSPEEAIPLISPTPLLVIHGDSDRVIPLEFGERIYERARQPKELWRIPGGHHLDLYFLEHGRYRQKILEYWDGLRSVKVRSA